MINCCVLLYCDYIILKYKLKETKLAKENYLEISQLLLIYISENNTNIETRPLRQG